MTQGMTKKTIIDRLTTLPNEIGNAEEHLLELTGKVKKARERLEEKETAIILGEIPGFELTGKNAEARAAQMRQFAEVERDEVRKAEDALASYKVSYNQLVNELSALKAISRMLSVEAA